jgi:hypothetical protein
MIVTRTMSTRATIGIRTPRPDAPIPFVWSDLAPPLASRNSRTATSSPLEWLGLDVSSNILAHLTLTEICAASLVSRALYHMPVAPMNFGISSFRTDGMPNGSSLRGQQHNSYYHTSFTIFRPIKRPMPIHMTCG